MYFWRARFGLLSVVCGVLGCDNLEVHKLSEVSGPYPSTELCDCLCVKTHQIQLYNSFLRIQNFLRSNELTASGTTFLNSFFTFFFEIFSKTYPTNIFKRDTLKTVFREIVL